MSIALGEKTRLKSAENLNQLLADTMSLRDLYKKHHWQVSGPAFYQLHLLFDKHYEEQSDMVDGIAERVQMLGGVTVATAHDVVELTKIPRAPKHREAVETQIARLLEAHEIIIGEAREFASQAAGDGDDGTNDFLVGSIIRPNEMQAWFVGEHVEKG